MGKAEYGKVIPFYRVVERPVASYIPPNNEILERTVIGICLYNPLGPDHSDDIGRAIEYGIGPDHFYQERHKKIWTAIESLYRQGETPTTVTVVDAMGISSSDNLSEWSSEEQYLAQSAYKLGAGGLLSSHLKQMHAYKVRRLMFLHGLQTIDAVAKSDNQDTEELVAQYQARALSVEAGIGRRHLTVPEMMRDELMSQDRERSVVPDHMTTGFAILDRVLTIDPPMLIVIAGRPSSGKTAFVLNVMLNTWWKQRAGGVMFSLDNSEKQIRKRLIAISGGPDIHKLMRPQLMVDEDFDGMLSVASRLSTLEGNVVFICDGKATMPKIAATVEMAKRRNPRLKYFVIDYLQLVDPVRQGRNVTREQEVASVASECKKIAQRLGLTGIVLSQLRKPRPGQEKVKPTMADLRDTGQIEQDADAVIMLYQTTMKNVIGVELAKNKDGELTAGELMFEGPQLRFGNLEKGEAGAEFGECHFGSGG